MNAPYTYDEVARALKKSFQKKGGWTGPDEVVVYGLQRPSWHLSQEGLEEHAAHDRSLLETLFLVAFQLGYNSGHVSQSKEIEMYRARAESYQEMYHSLSAKLPQPEVSEETKLELAEIWADALKDIDV